MESVEARQSTVTKNDIGADLVDVLQKSFFQSFPEAHPAGKSEGFRDVLEMHNMKAYITKQLTELRDSHGKALLSKEDFDVTMGQVVDNQASFKLTFKQEIDAPLMAKLEEACTQFNKQLKGEVEEVTYPKWKEPAGVDPNTGETFKVPPSKEISKEREQKDSASFPGTPNSRMIAGFTDILQGEYADQYPVGTSILPARGEVMYPPNEEEAQKMKSFLENTVSRLKTKSNMPLFAEGDIHFEVRKANGQIQLHLKVADTEPAMMQKISSAITALNDKPRSAKIRPAGRTRIDESYEKAEMVVKGYLGFPQERALPKEVGDALKGYINSHSTLAFSDSANPRNSADAGGIERLRRTQNIKDSERALAESIHEHLRQRAPGTGIVTSPGKAPYVEDIERDLIRPLTDKVKEWSVGKSRASMAL